MNYINILQDSIDTSVSIKIFKNREESSIAHIFKSKLDIIPISKFVNIDNFNPDRLQNSAEEAYPLPDRRPRGIDDINSVKYYQQKIKECESIPPIWMIYKNNKYILLDGAHRIIASYIEKNPNIHAYVIYLPS